METVKYNRFSWKTEGFNLASLILLTAVIFHAAIPFLLYLCWAIYILLTVIMYYATAPKIVFDNQPSSFLYGVKKEPSPEVSLRYLKKGVILTGYFKLSIAITPLVPAIVSGYFGASYR